MDILEIVFGDSFCYWMKKGKLGNHNVLMMKPLFNVGDLSNVKRCKIKIPKELCLEKENANFKKEVKVIINNIKKKNKIRVWTCRNDIYSYLVMLYICSIIKEYGYELYVLYSDDYNEEYLTPALMSDDELVGLSKLEHKLTNEEITNNANTWEKLVKENSELRVIKQGCVQSVSIDYYDKWILDTLKSLGKVKMSKLVAILMGKVNLMDTMYVYLIERLIKDNKIRITRDTSIRYFENLIEIVDN